MHGVWIKQFSLWNPLLNEIFLLVSVNEHVLNNWQNHTQNYKQIGKTDGVLSV